MTPIYHMPMGCGRPSLWGTYIKMQTALEYALAPSCLGCRVPIRTPLCFRNTTSPAAYDATLLQKEMLSRSYLSLSRTRVKSFLLPGPKDSFPPRRRRRRLRWRREMTPPPAKYSLISASIFRGSEGGRGCARGVTACRGGQGGGEGGYHSSPSTWLPKYDSTLEIP